jgi:hypothetical protein
MNGKIGDILERMKALESELEQELATRREQFRYTLENRKVHFERDILAQQKKFRAGLLRYIFTARPLHALTAPVIYAVAIPLVLLDLMVTLYQTVCFPIYGVPRVKRSDYLVFDRHHLAYLNLLEKVNCFYCSYANGLIPYFAEVVGRTEQYWCPIKHASRMHAGHSRYRLFSEYGDAEGFRRDLEKIRKDFEE